MPVCPHCGEDNPERARFCMSCTAPLTRAQPAEVRKTVTLLFSDLAGSTSLGERLDPEALREVMARYFDRIRTVLEGHGGVVEKFIGDAVMAVFGLPRAHEDDALRACRAAMAIKKALQELNEQFESTYGVRLTNRTGVHTGEVVAGDPALGQRLVTGDPVNTAARLEQAAPGAEVLIGEPTYRLVRAAVEADPVAPVTAKGKADPVRAWRLLSIRDTEAATRRMGGPMVGRKAELSTLLGAFEDCASSRDCRLVTVVGEAGIGKSRLVETFLDEIGDRARILQGRCLSYGEGITFWPLAEVIHQAAGVEEDEGREEAQKKIDDLADGHPDAELITRRVTAAMGLSEESFVLVETFWGARKLFEHLATARPLVVVFDDIHWAEPAFLELIEHVADLSSGAPLLLTCVARPDLLEKQETWRQGRPRSLSIWLEPLAETESMELIASLLGGASFPPGLRDRITNAAEGNPLFVEEMLAMLLDSGILSQDEQGRWVTTGLSDVVVPPTIWVLLAARLDRLDVDERTVLQRGSVIGQIFPLGAVRELSPEPLRPHVRAELDHLERRELIRLEPAITDDLNYRFRHILIRDAAYSGMLKRLRAELHERFADWLQFAAGERLAEYEEIIGYHLEQAYRYRIQLGPTDELARALALRAGRFLASAGLRAYARDDPAAVSLLSRADELLPAQEPFRLEVFLRLSKALERVGDYSRAQHLVEEARLRATAHRDRRLAAYTSLAELELGAATGAISSLQTALVEAERLVEEFIHFDDHLGLSHSYGLVGFLIAGMGQRSRGGEAFRLAAEHARRTGSERDLFMMLDNTSLMLLYGPENVDVAIRQSEQILKEVKSGLTDAAFMRCMLGRMYAMQGRLDEGRASIREGRALLTELGQAREAVSSAIDSGMVELLARDWGAAEAELRPACQALESMGEKGVLSTLAAMLAHALYGQGRLNEAEDFTRSSEESALSDDVISQVLWRGARAKLLAQGTRRENAEALAVEAVAIARETDDINLLGDALMDLAEVRIIQGRREDAVGALEDGLSMYEAKGNLVSAGYAREALERARR